jgi:hypothetical protein
MAKAKEGTTREEGVDILRVTTERVTFCILGTTPFVFNAMSAKVKGGLLTGGVKKTKMERESSVKHEPQEEYRASVYRSREDDSPSLLVFPSAGFKRAMASAALELPGVNKTQIGRLCWAEGFHVPIFGIPQLFMSVVRSADMKRTPDIRTRAILSEWACRVTVNYVTPNLRQQPVVNLMASAGVFIGVGDGRPEKGALNFGQFVVVDESDERFQRVIKSGGRAAQTAAMESPTYFDAETEELMEWYRSETKRRGFKVA